MIELVAVAFILSITTIIAAINVGGLDLLDPQGAKRISFFMLIIMLSLVHMAIRFGG